MKWQRRARFVIAVAAIAFGVLVALRTGRRATMTVEKPAAATDPQAVAESEGGQTFRVNREREEIRVKYERLVTYADNTSKMFGVNVTTERSDRTFVIAANEGQVGKDESTIELDGKVRVTVSDGLVLTAEHAVYTQNDGFTRVPGPAEFSRGRMVGSGAGLAFDQAQNILTITDGAHVEVGADAEGAGAMMVDAGTLEFRRGEHVMRFDRSMNAARGGQVLSADTAVAHLTEDEQTVQAMELRGQSRIAQPEPKPGQLDRLTGRDMDIRYAPDGRLLEHVVLNGDAVMLLAGEAQLGGRQIAASMIDISMAPDGATPKGLRAAENVRVQLPADRAGISRTIRAGELDGRGDDRRGITAATFTGGVQFNEKGPSLERTAASAVLDVAVSEGFSAINDARFSHGVRFIDGALSSTSAQARYVLDKGTLELSGSEPGSPTPHVVNDQIAVDATRLDVTLDGPVLKASGSVKSVLQAKKPNARSSEHDLKLPSMLKSDQPVNVTADSLDYRGADAAAVYTGNALLWQGETQIKAPSISIDSRKGDLVATGPVATVAMLTQAGEDGNKERARSVATAASFRYDDARRRAVYTGEAHLRGPQGDLTAERIEIFLKENGDEMDRLEGYDAVSLRAKARKTDGTRLTYYGDDGRYVVTGAPVKAVDECGRETTGKTLTFHRATDRIVVDGNEQSRTQTTGKSNCPGA